ncbi:hypothetical protein P9112_003352 [Eukaryota sp. TZLM1-RC]
MKTILLLCICITLALSSPVPPLRNSILVIHDDNHQPSDFKSLENLFKEYHFDYSSTDDDLHLRHLGKLTHDFFIFACPESDVPAANMEWDDLTDLIEEGANIALTMSEQTDEDLETALMELGFSIDEDSDQSPELHLVSADDVAIRVILTKRSHNRILLIENVESLANHYVDQDSYRTAVKNSFDLFLHERHDFRISNVSIQPAGHDVAINDGTFKISQPVKVCAKVEEWAGAAGNWDTVSSNDVYTVFKLVEEYSRFRMQFDTSSGQYCANIDLPEKYGVFTLTVELQDKIAGEVITTKYDKEFPIRPLRHDEFQRWIPEAFVFYTVVLVEVVVFVIFVIFFVVHRSQVVKVE